MAAQSFDEAVIAQPDGTESRLTHDQFFQLPLMRRVLLLTELKVRFYKAGRQITSAEAMK